jgi:hypothetical protein
MPFPCVRPEAPEKRNPGNKPNIFLVKTVCNENLWATKGRSPLNPIVYGLAWIRILKCPNRGYPTPCIVLCKRVKSRHIDRLGIERKLATIVGDHIEVVVSIFASHDAPGRPTSVAHPERIWKCIDLSAVSVTVATCSIQIILAILCEILVRKTIAIVVHIVADLGSRLTWLCIAYNAMQIRRANIDAQPCTRTKTSHAYLPFIGEVFVG